MGKIIDRNIKVICPQSHRLKLTIAKKESTETMHHLNSHRLQNTSCIGLLPRLNVQHSELASELRVRIQESFIPDPSLAIEPTPHNAVQLKKNQFCN